MLDVARVRAQFPALSRKFDDQTVAYFDGPAGSQVPQSVAAAVSDYLLHSNANCGAAFATSQETDGILAEARQACADFLNATTPDEIVFGANMTSLTFALSRTLAKTWFHGDEIIVSRLDHDANVTPWMTAARSAGAEIKQIEFDPHNCRLHLDQYASLLSNRTVLVAIGGASNATGTVHDVREITRLAKSVGAEVFVDAVHFAPHRLIDVQEFGCDYLACSAYKFFGPHVGILWGKHHRLMDLMPDKLRPASNIPPNKWMTGTQNHEGISGVRAAIDYLASLSEIGDLHSRRQRLAESFQLIQAHEQRLCQRLLAGLQQIPRLKIWGITAENELHERVATVSVTHASKTPDEIAKQLARQGLYVWSGNHYALPFTESAGLEPHGTLRIGLLHYNTESEVDRLLDCLQTLC